MKRTLENDIIILDNTNISEDELASINTSLVNNSVSILKLNRCGMGPNKAKELSVALKKNSSLVSLDLSGNALGVSGLAAIEEALVENKSITSLVLNHMNFTAPQMHQQFVKSVCNILRKNKNITSIELKGNDLNGAALEEILSALGENSTVIEINLAANQLKDEDMEKVSQFFQNNKKIKSLDLSNNAGGEKACQSLCKMIAGGKTLSILNIQGFGEQAMDYASVFAALLQNTSLGTVAMTYLNNNAYYSKCNMVLKTAQMVNGSYVRNLPISEFSPLSRNQTCNAAVFESLSKTLARQFAGYCLSICKSNAFLGCEVEIGKDAIELIMSYISAQDKIEAIRRTYQERRA